MCASPVLPAGVVVFERGWLSANNILFFGEGGAALVDSGYCTHSTQTVALLKQALQGRALDLLVNTHLHSDHCGGNAAIQAAFPGVRTLIPPGLATAVRVWDSVALTYQPTGQECPRFGIDGTLRAGETVELGSAIWEAHAAPGHDPHSIVLFEPVSRTLISADALWERGFGVVFPELEGERAFDEVASTLDLIEQLAPKVVIPGHGPVFTDLEAALANARSRLEGFVRDPASHARHAAKVLLKFKLLEWQRTDVATLMAWVSGTAYFQLVHATWWGEQQLRDWTLSLIDSLIRSNAAARSGEVITNA